MGIRGWILLGVVLSIASLFLWQEVRHSQKVRRLEGEVASEQSTSRRLERDLHLAEARLDGVEVARTKAELRVVLVGDSLRRQTKALQVALARYDRAAQKAMVLRTLEGRAVDTADYEPVAFPDTGRVFYDIDEHRLLAARLLTLGAEESLVAQYQGRLMDLTLTLDDLRRENTQLRGSPCRHRLLFCRCREKDRRKQRSD